MCGPLTIVASSPSRRRAALPVVASDAVPVQKAGQLTYQVTRLAGYAAIGAIFGALGHALDLSLDVTVSKLLPFLLVTWLVAQAIGLEVPKVLLPYLPLKRLARFRPPPGIPLAAFIGGITALIPCGFLYSTVPLAIAAGDAPRGAALLSAFALGTAPALVATSAFGSLAWMRRPRAQSVRRVVAALAAVFIVLRIAFVAPSAGVSEASAQPMHCHGAAVAK